MLEIRDLRTFHGRKIEALKGVSLKMAPGEIVTITGIGLGPTHSAGSLSSSSLPA